MCLLHRAFFATTIDTYAWYHGYNADSIPSFRFWSGRKNKYNYSCKIETGFLCGDGARVILFFARVIQHLPGRFLHSDSSR